MNKIRNYWKNRKGITLVWGAFFLVLMLMLAGMAIDLGYMYYVRNQLHVAADAAALAGVARLDGTNSTDQILARQEAWKFACKNRAAGDPVYLITNSSTDCNTPPASGLNEATNDPNGDIVLGNWNRTRPSTPVDLRFRPTPGNPLISTDVINAVKVVPRRTGATPGMPRVGVFWGQIFRILGGEGWVTMSASASAIATRPPRASSFVAVGNEFCPLAGNPVCVGGTGSTDPTTCILVTPREIFAAPTSAPDSQKMGWTSLLYKPGSTPAFETLMCGTSPYQDICPPVSGIWGIPGTSTETFRNYESLMCDPGFDASAKEINASGQVTGWEVLIPIVDRPDPMSAPDPNPVWGYAKVHIIAICAPGTAGCRGTGSCLSSGFCSGGADKIVVDRISCIACGSESFGHKPALVK
jgi:hypothetical protein